MAHPPRVASLPWLRSCSSPAFLLAGCGESEDKADEKSPAEVMEQAKKHFDDASSVHIALSTDSVPTSGDGVLGATGDVTHDPAFKGDVKVLFQGFPAELPVTAVDGKVYAKLPFSAKTAVIDPADYGVPDPAEFADPENGLSGLLTEIKDLKKGKETRSGDQILTTYSGELPGATVKKVIPSAEAGADLRHQGGRGREGIRPHGEGDRRLLQRERRRDLRREVLRLRQGRQDHRSRHVIG